MMDEKNIIQKQPWLKLYTIVLLANLLFIVAFYIIMNAF